jgi:hypothetical protein
METDTDRIGANYYTVDLLVAVVARIMKLLIVHRKDLPRLSTRRLNERKKICSVVIESTTI